MRTRLTLHPGQDGAKRMQAQYGDRLSACGIGTTNGVRSGSKPWS